MNILHFDRFNIKDYVTGFEDLEPGKSDLRKYQFILTCIILLNYYFLTQRGSSIGSGYEYSLVSQGSQGFAVFQEIIFKSSYYC